MNNGISALHHASFFILHYSLFTIHYSLIFLYTLFVAAVTHSDVRIVAAEHNLAALGDDAAVLVYSGIYARLLAAGADRLDLGDRVRELKQSH